MHDDVRADAGPMRGARQCHRLTVHAVVQELGSIIGQLAQNQGTDFLGREVLAGIGALDLDGFSGVHHLRTPCMHVKDVAQNNA